MPPFWLSFSLFSLLSFSVHHFLVPSSLFMASSSNEKSGRNATNSTSPVAIDEKKKTPNSLNTTFIQTNPSNFKAIVHKFTGLPGERLPATALLRPAGKPTSGQMGPRKPTFKLHERRQSARKLEIMLNHGGIFGENKVMFSPVSPFELLAHGSPRSSTPTPTSTRSSAPAVPPPLMDEEMRGILEKGYYLHPSSFTPRGSKPPPLLPLFPIDPTSDHFDDDDDDDDDEDGGDDVHIGDASSSS